MNIQSSSSSSSGNQASSATFPPLQSSSSGHHQGMEQEGLQLFDGLWNSSRREEWNGTSSLPSNLTTSISCQSKNNEVQEEESDDSEDDSFFSDDEEEEEDEFKFKLKRLGRWMDNDLTSIQQVVTILSLVNRSKKLDATAKSFIRSHINIFNNNEEGQEEDRKKQEEERRSFERKVQDANSLNFWQLYFNARANVPRNDELLDLLLQYLPLVHISFSGSNGDSSCCPDVTPLNILYLHLISSVLSKVVSLRHQPASSELLSKCRSLMSLALISRCFTKEQKASLNAQFMAKLLLQSHASKQLIQSESSSSSLIRFNSSFNLPPQPQQASSSSNVFQQQQELLPSSSSEQQQLKQQHEVKVAPFSGEGMSLVPPFLKTLRLHKYTDCFASLPSLGAFMDLTESDLESLGVAAKGARKKFCQHLEKLRARPQILSQLLLSSNDSVDVYLSGIQTALAAGPLSRESKTEINLILHLLLKIKSVELSCEQSVKLVETIDKCLQLPIWSREETRMLIQLKEPIKSKNEQQESSFWSSK